MHNPVSWVDPLGLSGCPDIKSVDKIPLSRNSARKLFKNRGLKKQIQHNTINSFDGKIYVSRGKKVMFSLLLSMCTGSAPQVYVTREYSGATSGERRSALALPPNNSASYEGKIALTRDQVLLEGKVAPQLQWGADKTEGGWQIVTTGGKYSGATISL